MEPRGGSRNIPRVPRACTVACKQSIEFLFRVTAEAWAADAVVAQEMVHDELGTIRMGIHSTMDGKMAGDDDEAVGRCIAKTTSIR